MDDSRVVSGSERLVLGSRRLNVLFALCFYLTGCISSQVVAVSQKSTEKSTAVLIASLTVNSAYEYQGDVELCITTSSGDNQTIESAVLVEAAQLQAMGPTSRFLETQVYAPCHKNGAPVQVIRYANELVIGPARRGRQHQIALTSNYVVSVSKNDRPPLIALWRQSPHAPVACVFALSFSENVVRHEYSHPYGWTVALLPVTVALDVVTVIVVIFNIDNPPGDIVPFNKRGNTTDTQQSEGELSTATESACPLLSV